MSSGYSDDEFDPAPSSPSGRKPTGMSVRDRLRALNSEEDKAAKTKRDTNSGLSALAAAAAGGTESEDNQASKAEEESARRERAREREELDNVDTGTGLSTMLTSPRWVGCCLAPARPPLTPCCVGLVNSGRAAALFGGLHHLPAALRGLRGLRTTRCDHACTAFPCCPGKASTTSSFRRCLPAPPTMLRRS